MTKELTTGFDYESVDKETAGKLAYYAERGHKLIKASQIQFIASMGELLSEAREELAHHGNGTFLKWATSEFDITQKTIYNYVNAWDRCLCNGYTNFLNLSPTAIYLLTAEDTPKPVVKKVEHLAAQQEPVRKADIQRLIDASRPKAKRHSDMTPEEIDQDMLAEQEAILDAEDRGIAPTILGTSDDLHADETETAAEPLSGPAVEGSQQANAKPAEAAAPNSDEKPPAWRMARSKAKKTVEALMRAIGDLNDLKRFTYSEAALQDCRDMITELVAMK